MSRLDFKKEPALQQMQRVWHENRGNWLLGISAGITLLACAIGYFEAIPEITASKRTGQPSLILGGRTLIVHVEGCVSDEGQVVAMLYSGEAFNEDSLPMRIEMLHIEEHKARWSIHNLPYGRYAVYAFHDIDANDQVSTGREPQGLSADPKRVAESARMASSKIDYSHAAFDFTINRQEVTVQLH